MTIGPDIEEALDEVGTAVTIYDSSNVAHSGEYIYYKPNSQATKPFIREFFLEAWLPYNTAASSGNLIKFNVTGTYYMLMNLTPFMFENSIIRKDGVLYKCNVTAVLLRPREVRGSTNYLSRTVWDVISSSMRCLVTTPLYGNVFETDEALGQLGLEVHELYARDIYEIKVNDRIKLSSDQYYRVESVKYRRYDGVTVYELGEDTRAYTTTTTTTSTITTTTTSTTATASNSSSSTTTSTTTTTTATTSSSSSTTTSTTTTTTATTSSSSISTTTTSFTTTSSSSSSSTTTQTVNVVEITETVAATANDGRRANTYFATNDTSIPIGNVSGVICEGFWRFTNVSIPVGATIAAAKIQLKANASLSTTTCNLKVHCENADSPAAPSSISDFNGRSLTTGVEWNNVGSQTAYSWYDSPDISTEVQTVVDRVGWAENNALIVFIKNNGSSTNAYRQPGEISDSSGFAAKLVVTYAV